MRTRAQYLALFAECLSIPAVLWVFSATLFLKDAPEPFPELIWTLLMAAATYGVYIILLRRPRTIPVIAVVSTVLFGLQIWGYIRLYRGETYFGFILTILLMSAVTAYANLYYSLRVPQTVKHLFFLDLVTLALLWLTLFLSVVRVSTFSVVLTVAVLLLDIGGLIALRMSEEGESEGIGKAFLLAFCSAAVLAAVIYLLVKVFSRSAGITGAFINGIARFFRMIWGWIDRFASWIASLFDPAEMEEAGEMAPTMAGDMEATVLEENMINPVPIAIAIGVIIALIAIIILIRLRKNKAGLGSIRIGGVKSRMVTRKKRKAEGFFAKWIRKLIFAKNAFLYRNTPRGVLVWLEKRAKRKKAPRQPGESIREFVSRLAPKGELSSLADDLDQALYGGGSCTLTAEECRNLKKAYRNMVKTNTGTAKTVPM